MTRKPGVFDPWRQAMPKSVAPKSRVKDPDDPSKPDEICVNFKGLRTGINVWLPQDDFEHPDVQAQHVLVTCVRALTTTEVHRLLFASWGVYLTPQAGAVKLGDHAGYLYIVVPGDHEQERAVDALALAFRAAQNEKESPAEQVLEKARVKPFVV
jgi:hypothetical protein